MTDVLQCPYCDLRFTSRSELEQHKAFDHPGKEDEVAAEEPAAESAQAAKREPEPAPSSEKRGFLGRLFGGP